MAADVKVPKPVRCSLDDQECVSVQDLLVSFNAPLSEEHVWALCYQCANCYKNVLGSNAESTNGQVPMIVSALSHIRLHKEGFVHESTIFPEDDDDPPRIPVSSEKELVTELGRMMFLALDFGYGEDEERNLGPEIADLIDYMVQNDHDETPVEPHTETDDEGIERDSDDDYQQQPKMSGEQLDHVLEMCTQHIGSGAVPHYRAVCRALVAEALELSTFLMRVSQGTKELRGGDGCYELDLLHHTEWARFWMQVIGELRMGVKLKKVMHSRAPIEFELTPYEILMDDIRSRRYNLRKTSGYLEVPHRLKKDAHALILDFIRSRPPLRKASERKLAPLKINLSPREQLLASIKNGRRLKHVATPLRGDSKIAAAIKREASLSNSQGPPRPMRRPIKADFSILQMNDSDDDDDDDDSPCESPQDKRPAPEPSLGSPWKRTAYDLATQCPSRRASMRRHTIVACGGSGGGWLRDSEGSASVPPSRPDSRQSDVDSHKTPELTWSRTSLQDELMQSKQWQDALSLDERLSLTLEEIVHIRSVLTKAELEGLPVECRVKADAEKRKVCFLCLKTRFGIFGPWGQRCKLCKRTVCAKCYSKMRIPTEHFRNVPVVLLSPSMGTPCTSPPPTAPCSPGGPTHHPMDESFPRSLMARLMLPDNEKKNHNSIGSAPNSPNKGRCSAPDSMTCSMEEGPKSLPPSSPRHQTMDRRSRFGRTITSAGMPGASERLRGELMNVCHDCRSLVIQIIRASRPTRSALRNHALRNLTLDLSPIYTNAGTT